ncbi:MAG: hypothetical protein HC871_08740 [Rhizobiales bacterium]|nr:hypothetical protein [Hyphomicrobiales bacterium]
MADPIVVSQLIKMTRRGLSYAQLVERLAEIGVKDDERNVRNKVSRGKLTAAFMLQCLEAIDVENVSLK